MLVTEDENTAKCLLLFYEGQYLRINKLSSQNPFTAHVLGEVAAAPLNSEQQDGRSHNDLPLPSCCPTLHSTYSTVVCVLTPSTAYNKGTTKNVTLQRSKNCGDMQFGCQMT